MEGSSGSSLGSTSSHPRSILDDLVAIHQWAR